MDRLKDWFLDLPQNHKIGYLIFALVGVCLVVLSLSSLFMPDEDKDVTVYVDPPNVQSSPTPLPTVTPDVPKAEPLDADGDRLSTLPESKLSVDEERKALDVARTFTNDFSNWKKGQTFSQRESLIAKSTTGQSQTFDYDPILAQNLDAHFDDSDLNPKTSKTTLVSSGKISALAVAGGDEKRLRILSTASVRMLDIDPNTGQGMTSINIYSMVYVLDMTKVKGEWKVMSVASHS